MAVDNTTKTITAPVGIGELASFFGRATMDIGNLIKGMSASYVNKFSRVKPLRSDTLNIEEFKVDSGEGYWGLNVLRNIGSPSIHANVVSSSKTQYGSYGTSVAVNGYIYPDSQEYRNVGGVLLHQVWRFGDFKGYNGSNGMFANIRVSTNIPFEEVDGVKVYDFNSLFTGLYINFVAEFNTYMPYNDWFNGECDNSSKHWYICVEFVKHGDSNPVFGSSMFFFYKKIESNTTVLKIVGEKENQNTANGIYAFDSSNFANSSINYKWDVYVSFARIDTSAKKPSGIMLPTNWLRKEHVFIVDKSKTISGYIRATLLGCAKCGTTAPQSISSTGWYTNFSTLDLVRTSQYDIILKLQIENRNKATFETGYTGSSSSKTGLFFQARLTTCNKNGKYDEIVVDGYTIDPSKTPPSNPTSDHTVTIEKNASSDVTNTYTVYVLFKNLVPNQSMSGLSSIPTRGDYIEIRASSSRGGSAFSGDDNGLNIEAEPLHITQYDWYSNFTYTTLKTL